MVTHTNKNQVTQSDTAGGSGARFFAPAFVQTKLTVNEPGDRYEQEADAMADKVMRMAAPQSAATGTEPFFKAGPGMAGIQRKCKGCEEEEKKSHSVDAGIQRKCKDCENEEMLHREESGSPKEPGAGPPQPSTAVQQTLQSSGQMLDPGTRSFMEQRFGHDFGQVQVHNDPLAHRSSSDIQARAYTHQHHIVFGEGQYQPQSESGRHLLAHELTHVIQQDPAKDQIARQVATCTPAATCGGGPIPGSAQDADTTGTAQEVSPRDRRKKMTPARAVATGHGGRALALERFFEAQAPGRLAANLQGIFVDQDISSFFTATTTDCAGWIADSLPPGSPIPGGMAGATKQCTFVHGSLNQQAEAFNTTTASVIGGKPREQWRAETLAVLIHESEHPRFEAATGALPPPPGVTSPTCQRADILQELSEIAAILSEFPTMIRAATAEANPHGPLHHSLTAWFHCKIQDCGENIQSAMEQIGCRCTCPEVNAFIIETFNFESTTWTLAEKDAFHRELIKPVWGIHWPLHPSTP